VDLLLLITIDCMRAEAFRESVTPRLAELAKSGRAMTRAYSGGSRTRISLPILQHGYRGSVPVAHHLGAKGIDSTMVVGLSDRSVIRLVSTGFTNVLAPTEGKWSAREVTD